MTMYSSSRQFCEEKKKVQIKYTPCIRARTLHDGASNTSLRFHLKKWRVAKDRLFIFCTSVIFDDGGKICFLLASFWRCVKARGTKKGENWRGLKRKNWKTNKNLLFHTQHVHRTGKKKRFQKFPPRFPLIYANLEYKRWSTGS